MRIFPHTKVPFLERGLYAGALIRFGNRISEFGNRSRRKFAPNLHYHRLAVPSLAASIRVRTSTRALRRIEEVGGVEEYVLGGGEPRGHYKAEGIRKAVIVRRWREELQGKGLGLTYKLRDGGQLI